MFNPMGMLMESLLAGKPGEIEIPINLDEAKTPMQRRALEVLKNLSSSLPIPPVMEAFLPSMVSGLCETLTDDQILVWVERLDEQIAYITDGPV